MKGLSLLVMALSLIARPAAAAVDLLLDIAYDHPADEHSPGEWSLYVRASHLGLERIAFALIEPPPLFGERSQPPQVMAPVGYLGEPSVGTWIRVGLQPMSVRESSMEFGQLDYSTYSNILYMLHGLGTTPFGDPSTLWAREELRHSSTGAPQLWMNVPWASQSPRTGWEAAVHLLRGEFKYGFPPYFLDNHQAYQAEVFITPPGVGLGMEAYTGQIRPDTVRLFVQHNRGDYNLDGQVDGADYTVWRDSDRSAVNYALWKENFDQPIAWERDFSESAASNVVPEPRFPIVALTVALLGFCRARMHPFSQSGIHCSCCEVP
jgi:hypothetical protein